MLTTQDKHNLGCQNVARFNVGTKFQNYLLLVHKTAISKYSKYNRVQFNHQLRTSSHHLFKSHFKVDSFSQKCAQQIECLWHLSFVISILSTLFIESQLIESLLSEISTGDTVEETCDDDTLDNTSSKE